MQPYASMGGESHGTDTETTRPADSYEATEPLFIRTLARGIELRLNSLSAAVGYDETVKPCRCKPEQGIRVVRYPPGYGAKLNAAENRRGLTPPTHI